MTVDKRRTDACLKACAGISTQSLEDNAPFLELALRYNVVLRERDALRAKIAQMEKQEPVATVIKEGDSRYWMSERLWTFPDGKYPLYALPGAKTQGEEK